MRIRNYSSSTIKNYIDAVTRFAKYLGTPPDRLAPEDIRTYQIHLVEEKQVSLSYQKIVVAGLRFLYGKTLAMDWPIDFIPHARTEKRLPVILSQQEVVRILAAPATRSIVLS